MKFFNITIFLTLLGMGLGVQASPTDCIVLDRFPATIDEPGNYCLDRSHDLALGNYQPAIRIVSSNVDLDLRQHTLANFLADDGFCLNSGMRYSSIGILAYEVSNVSVHSGTLKCFASAVEFGANGNCYDCNVANQVHDLTVDTAWTWGIFMQGSQSVIADNHVSGVGGNEQRTPLGIHVQGSANTIRNNDVMRVFGEDNAGIGTAAGYGNLVVGNRVQSAGIGFRLYGGAELRYRDNLTANVVTRYLSQGTDLGNNH